MKTSSIINKLFKFIRPYRRRFIVALICMTCVSALTASIIYMVKPVMDGIFAAGNIVIVPILNIEIPKVNMIYYLAGIIIGLALFKGLFDYIAKYYMAYIGQNVTKDLRNRVFRHMVYLSLSYYVSNPTGQLLSKITNDVRYLEQSVVKIPVKLIKDGLQFIFLVFT